ncbi:uncharacterized protein [Dermacentor andersoni]|uniref:uncharacterized protein isoform X2 n=1 Tax=Dermacentor andersoni TaxID=34620 RepID=UPI002416AA4F|nr:uncharacterized protein LOC129380339 isoform X2 [Dermacentor andersoni]
MLLSLCTLLCAQMHHVLADLPFYPEIDATLQYYQDLSTCSLDKVEWSLVYRNFHDDVYFGSIKCIRFHDLGVCAEYATANLSLRGNCNTTHVIILGSSWNYTAKNLIITDTSECYGCTYWRSFDRIHQQAEGCEFIYDELCGTTPKYDLYDPTCTPVTFSILLWEPVTPPPPSPPPTTTPTDAPPKGHPGHQNPWDILNPLNILKLWKQWKPGDPLNIWEQWKEWIQGNQSNHLNPWNPLNIWKQRKEWIQGNQSNKLNAWNPSNLLKQWKQWIQGNHSNQWNPGKLWSPLTDVAEGVTGSIQSLLNPFKGK